MLIWSALLGAQFISAISAYRRLPRDPANREYVQARYRQVAFTLAALGGVVPAVAWLTLVGVFALERVPGGDAWFTAHEFANDVLLVCHAIALIVVSFALLLSLTTHRREFRIMLLEGLVLGNPTLPQLVMCLVAVI